MIRVPEPTHAGRLTRRGWLVGLRQLGMRREPRRGTRADHKAWEAEVARRVEAEVYAENAALAAAAEGWRHCVGTPPPGFAGFDVQQAPVDDADAAAAIVAGGFGPPPDLWVNRDDALVGIDFGYRTPSAYIDAVERRLGVVEIEYDGETHKLVAHDGRPITVAKRPRPNLVHPDDIEIDPATGAPVLEASTDGLRARIKDRILRHARPCPVDGCGREVGDCTHGEGSR